MLIYGFKGFLTALEFLTVLPISRKRGPTSDEELGLAAAFFPLIGGLIGVLLVFLNAVSLIILPRQVTDLILIITLILLTGGLHLDGLADSADGFFATRDRKRVLDIMRDSRLGSMGVVAIFLCLLLKYLGLTNIPSSSKPYALILMPLFGRWSMVHLAFLSPYARESSGIGKAFCEHVKKAHWFFASAQMALFGLLFLGWRGAFVCLTILLLSTLICRYSLNRIGGVTGDVFGASEEITETMTLLVLLAYGIRV
jgi:adenosylcobinamide-GDP ribazoletransferase